MTPGVKPNFIPLFFNSDKSKLFKPTPYLLITFKLGKCWRILESNLSIQTITLSASKQKETRSWPESDKPFSFSLIFLYFDCNSLMSFSFLEKDLDVTATKSDLFIDNYYSRLHQP